MYDTELSAIASRSTSPNERRVTLSTRFITQEDTPTMKKRIIALLLCLAALVAVLASCSGSIDADSEYKGQQITMYLSENIYDLDPVNAYKNESMRAIVSLLFDTLFKLDENGKVTESLAKSYRTEKTSKGEYFMYIEIKDDARWSDNQPVTADDVVFAWKRILNPNNSYGYASLLFDIKNARKYNEAEVSKDDIGLIADGKLLTIQFEKEIDYDQFLLNLTSLALAPLREDIASKNVDWAKKPGIMSTSGPFKLSKVGFYKNGTVVYEDINYSVKKTDENNKVLLDKNGNAIYKDATEPDFFGEQRVSSYILERNLYYYRNAEDEEKLDKSVTPYRIIVDCSLSEEEILEAYNKGIIAYIGDIPVSLRDDLNSSVTKKDSLSTNICYLNQNAEILTNEIIGYEDEEETMPIYRTEKLFAITEVRQALSLAIDRDQIAKDLVFAKKATGLVPTGVFDTNSADKLFRNTNKKSYEYLNTDLTEAKALLAEAGITASDYSFSITVPCYDEVYLYVAEQLVEAWGTNGLGFNVTLNKRGTVANNDYHRDVASVPGDLCDDLWAEDIMAGKYEVAILDLVAPSADPFSVLAPFARKFSGQAMDMSDPESYVASTHSTGYDSEEYNALIEKIYNNKNTAKRSADLHAAEDILMEDMPIIPIVFNQTAYVVNDDVLELNDKSLFSNSNEYYYPVPFDKIEVKDYEKYELKCAKYVFENYEEWTANPKSYFCVTFAGLSLNEFVYTNSNYFYLFKDKYGVSGYEWMPEKPEKTNKPQETTPEQTPDNEDATDETDTGVTE